MAQGKVYSSAQAALADIREGSTVLVSGFAGHGVANGLVAAMEAGGVGGLTVVYCSGPVSESGSDQQFPASAISQLVTNGQVKKLISPLPFAPGNGGVIQEQWQSGQLEIEVVPHGILVERLRAGGAGIGGVFLATAVGTRFETGKEKRSFANGEAVLELPMKADYAVIKVSVADTLGSAIYEGSGRNWAPVMAMAARITIAEAEHIVEPGELNPEGIISPGIFVNRIVAAND